MTAQLNVIVETGIHTGVIGSGSQHSNHLSYLRTSKPANEALTKTWPSNHTGYRFYKIIASAPGIWV